MTEQLPCREAMPVPNAKGPWPFWPTEWARGLLVHRMRLTSERAARQYAALCHWLTLHVRAREVHGRDIPSRMTAPGSGCPH
jgi:hypothetical protein